ncbi:hypothetical protein ASD54_11045 [Rhizobium sp. Root149]|uniref:hypothetical protein n=1 Tax=Rhizobium sp. Root149 TaxID=1736473 RepID=UPI000713843E|nr:hypothetical protein [Rhizobium sp. Root149]KQZ50736.1 hypothetical protein ASD54_11045 [Rhizobium sp. Root149]
MDLNDILKSAADQNAGHQFELLDPVGGNPTGLKFTIAGPDSERARNANAKLEAALTKLTSRSSGRVSTDDRTRLVIDFLFDVTVSWDVKQGGKKLELTREHFGRVLGAASWVRAQVDTFAADRSPYYRDEVA